MAIHHFQHPMPRPDDEARHKTRRKYTAKALRKHTEKLHWLLMWCSLPALLCPGSQDFAIAVVHACKPPVATNQIICTATSTRSMSQLWTLTTVAVLGCAILQYGPTLIGANNYCHLCSWITGSAP